MRGNQAWDRIVKRIAASYRGAAKKRDRRRLFFEPLEGRQLLAADLELTGAEYQNGANPYDVNADGSLAPSDAVIVANKLTEGDSSYGFPDINGDSVVTATDMELVVEAVTAAMGGSAESSAASTSGTCIDLHVDPVAPIPEGSVFTISGHVDNYDDCQADTIWISRLDIDAWNYGDFGPFAAETFLQEDGTYDFDVSAIDSVSPAYPTDLEVLTVTVTNVAPQLTVSLTDPNGQPITDPINEGDTVRLEATIVDPGVLDDQTLVIDWGNGSSTSITREAPDPGESPWLDFWSPVEPQAGPLTITESFTYTYLDDDPTGTPSDSYTITVTATDDDGGTDSQVLSLTVNNVAPSVVINSITPIDSVSPEQGGVDGQIDETEGFIIEGTVTDPGVLDTFPAANLEVDLNFDGTIDPFTEVFPLTLQGGNGSWTFVQRVAAVLDDGPSPGNRVPIDVLAVDVEVTDDDTGADSRMKAADVFNVAPTFDGDPSVVLDFDDDGNPITATLSGAYSDIGTLDEHILTIEWGDGIANTVVPSGGAFSVTRPLPTSDDFTVSDIYPIDMQLEDDDLGFELLSLNYNCGCGCADPAVDMMSDAQASAEGEGPAEAADAITLDKARFITAPTFSNPFYKFDVAYEFNDAAEGKYWIQRVYATITANDAQGGPYESLSLYIQDASDLKKTPTATGLRVSIGDEINLDAMGRQVRKWMNNPTVCSITASAEAYWAVFDGATVTPIRWDDETPTELPAIPYDPALHDTGMLVNYLVFTTYNANGTVDDSFTIYIKREIAEVGPCPGCGDGTMTVHVKGGWNQSTDSVRHPSGRWNITKKELKWTLPQGTLLPEPMDRPLP